MRLGTVWTPRACTICRRSHATGSSSSLPRPWRLSRRGFRLGGPGTLYRGLKSAVQAACKLERPGGPESRRRDVTSRRGFRRSAMRLRSGWPARSTPSRATACFRARWPPTMPQTFGTCSVPCSCVWRTTLTPIASRGFWRAGSARAWSCPTPCSPRRCSGRPSIIPTACTRLTRCGVTAARTACGRATGFTATRGRARRSESSRAPWSGRWEMRLGLTFGRARMVPGTPTKLTRSAAATPPPPRRPTFPSTLSASSARRLPRGSLGTRHTSPSCSTSTSQRSPASAAPRRRRARHC